MYIQKRVVKAEAALKRIIRVSFNEYAIHTLFGLETHVFRPQHNLYDAHSLVRDVILQVAK